MDIKLCQVLSHPRIGCTSYCVDVVEVGPSGASYKAEVGFPYTDTTSGGGMYYAPSGWHGKKATYCLVAFPDMGTPVVICFLGGSLNVAQKYIAEIPFKNWYQGHPNYRLAKRPLLWENPMDDYGGMLRLYTGSRNKFTVYDRAASFFDGIIPSIKDLKDIYTANSKLKKPLKNPLPVDELYYINSAIGSYDIVDLPKLAIEKERYFRSILGSTNLLFKQLETGSRPTPVDSSGKPVLDSSGTPIPAIPYTWANLLLSDVVYELSQDTYKEEIRNFPINLDRLKIRKEDLLKKKDSKATHAVNIEDGFWLADDPQFLADSVLEPTKWVPEPDYIKDDFSVSVNSESLNRVTVSLGEIPNALIDAPPTVPPSTSNPTPSLEFYRTSFRPSIINFDATTQADTIHLIKISTNRVPTDDLTYETNLDANIAKAQHGKLILDTTQDIVIDPATGKPKLDSSGKPVVQNVPITTAKVGRAGTMPLVFVPGKYTIMAIKLLRDSYKLQTFGSNPVSILTDDQLTSLIVSDPDLSDEDHWVPAFV